MKYIIISGASDIGNAIIKDLSTKDNEIIYTYKTKKIKKLKNLTPIKLDVNSKKKIKTFAKNKILNNWESLVIMPASQMPIGLFSETKADEWYQSVDLNFTNQMYLLRLLVEKRLIKKNFISNVILWAGTGSNSAPKYYSAYTISKIAQTKMAELLDEEFENIKFSIIGPGWVKTKIHKQTIAAGKKARENYHNTIQRFKLNKFNLMEDVVNCFNKVVDLPKKAAGGRNFSVEFDKWEDSNLKKILEVDSNMYKLRRDFNHFIFSDLDFNIENTLDIIAKNKNFQNPSSSVYKIFKRIFHFKFTLDYFLSQKKISKYLNINFTFPHIELGNISSTHMFGVDELLIFKFYFQNKKKYKKVCDIGGNIGLHSLILGKLGFEVDTYEPDPKHCKIATKIFEDNNIKVNLNEMAVSNYTGNADFTRIINNTTGNYILNKKSSYGPKEKLKVKVIDAKKLCGKYDLIKIDAEGSEADILHQFDKSEFNKTDFILEVTTESSAENLWKKINKDNLKAYAQKISWERIKKIEDLPTSWREGSVIISSSFENSNN